MKQSHYFSHDFYARRDPKLLKLVIKLGLKGLGLYWCIVEILHEQEGILKEEDLDLVCFELKIKKKYLIELLENFDLFAKVEKNYINFSVNRRIQEKKQKSQKAKNSANWRWNLQPDNGLDANASKTHCETDAIIKKERKKINKENMIIGIECDQTFTLEELAELEKPF